MNTAVKNYLIVTASYWSFTITDGAIRMLVVLYFHLAGYTPLEVAMLFLFYEFFGVVTNLLGGWLASHIGLNRTMHIGMALQIGALLMLTVPDSWLGVAYVMFAQAISGIAKDLNKMSAKASIRTFLPEQSGSRLFKWVAILTGSKNALKGAGFFIGATLLQFLQFRGALLVLSGFLLAFLLLALLLLPSELGKTRAKTRFKQIFSRNAAINWLSAARFFLFGARDIWFVVALPVYLYEVMDWKFAQVGSFFALWIIGYGIVQASAPALLRRSHAGAGPDSQAALFWSCVLFGLMLLLVGGFYYQPASTTFLIIGLGGFALIFAINSAVHSFLIVNWSEHDRVALNVGFYYMSNAAGRLAGTVLSGLLYQYYSLLGCLIASAVFVAMTALMSMKLKRHRSAAVDTD